LDSIAAPIHLVQFPTVTVCPAKNTQPDNWSYLEKVLNFLSFECQQKDKLTWLEQFNDYDINCTDTIKLRNDYDGLIQILAESIKRLYNGMYQ
jgi:hypothetical protein